MFSPLADTTFSSFFSGVVSGAGLVGPQLGPTNILSHSPPPPPLPAPPSRCAGAPVSPCRGSLPASSCSGPASLKTHHSFPRLVYFLCVHCHTGWGSALWPGSSVSLGAGRTPPSTQGQWSGRTTFSRLDHFYEDQRLQRCSFPLSLVVSGLAGGCRTCSVHWLMQESKPLAADLFWGFHWTDSECLLKCYHNECQFQPRTWYRHPGTRGSFTQLSHVGAGLCRGT